MKRILKLLTTGVLLVCMTCCMSVSVFATDTVANAEDVANAANAEDVDLGDEGKVTLDEELGDAGELAENAGVETADGNGTVTTQAPDSGSPLATTTAPKQEGAISVKTDLNDEQLQALDRIKKELEAEKKNQFSGAFGMLTMVAGIIVIIYTFVVLFAFFIDKLNLSGDVEVLRIVTFSNAVALRDEDDRALLTENQKDGSKKTYVMGLREILINTLIGVLAGLALTQTEKIYMLLQQVYLTLVGG